MCIRDRYDIAQIMLKAGLGIAGLLIIVFSTVTTTFLDAYSAGISSETVVNKWNGKHVAIVVTVLGTIAAIVYPMDNITDFLYLIGSVSVSYTHLPRGCAVILIGICQLC